MKNAFILSFSVLLLIGCGTQKQAVQTSSDSSALTRVDDRDRAVRSNVPEVGKLMAPFREMGMDGKVWTNLDLDGHVSVFYLWYQGCTDALSEMGELAIWKQMYPDVQFFSVTWHDVATTVRLAKQYHFTWIPLANATQMISWINQGVGEKSLSPGNYPVTIVVDQQGFVRRAVRGTDMQTRQETLRCIQQLR